MNYSHGSRIQSTSNRLVLKLYSETALKLYLYVKQVNRSPLTHCSICNYYIYRGRTKMQQPVPTARIISITPPPPPQQQQQQPQIHQARILAVSPPPASTTQPHAPQYAFSIQGSPTTAHSQSAEEAPDKSLLNPEPSQKMQMLKKWGGIGVSTIFEALSISGLVAFFRRFDPYPTCCSKTDSSLVVIAALPIIAILFSVAAYFTGTYAAVVDSNNNLHRLVFYKNLLGMLSSGFALATTIGGATIYGTTVAAAAQLIVGKMGSFGMACRSYLRVRQQVSNIPVTTLAAAGSINGFKLNDTTPGRAKCGFLGNACCSLYVLITVAITLGVMAANSGANIMCMNNYQGYWAGCNCSHLPASLYSADGTGYIDYGVMTSMNTASNYGIVYDYCQSSELFCCTWAP
jgi:hypothetical protein